MNDGSQLHFQFRRAAAAITVEGGSPDDVRSRLRSVRRQRVVARRVGGAAVGVMLVASGLWLGMRVEPASTIHPATSVTGVWGELPAPPLGPRLLSVSVATNDGWFVWGGRKQRNGDAAGDPEVEGAYYDQATGEWRTLPGAPLEVSPGQEIGTAVWSEIGAAVWSGAEVVVVIGGATPQFAAFDPQAFTWRSIAVPADVMAQWPVRNGEYDAPGLLWSADRVVVLLPGFADDRAYSSMLTLDPATGTFVVSSPAPQPMRTETPVVASESSLYFVDASGGDCRGTRQVHVYDIVAGTWSDVALPHDNWVPSIVAWTGTGLLVAGGADCTSDQAGVRFAAVLDGGSVTWRAAADLPEDHRNVMFAPTAAADGLVASLDYDGAPFVYDAVLDRWWVGPPIIPSTVEAAIVSAARLVALGRDLVIWSPQLNDSTTTGTVLHLAIPDPSTWPDPPAATTSP
ncbi:MAG: hypothetical protein Q7T27_06410 [Pseudomonas sp.]|uniref:hypothetical protein n=1 Tax=Pseudomonas sp. TaxID=306 RepID=UPI00271B22C9|nr:hypothetical protein [Pseudomonas sp.]MDO8403111.1 hypothetical protein [Pseudomonas sp.]